MAQRSTPPALFSISSTPPEKRLVDPYGRTIHYLRLAVTDRCNLRCRYCMPEEGIPNISHPEILRFEELERLVRLFASMGVKKVRLTGGEPFTRKGLVPSVRRIQKIKGIESVHITTNGVAAAPCLDDLKEAGLSGINLSLDSMDRERFRAITGRDVLNRVLLTLEKALKLELPLKINTVMLDDFNVDDMGSLAELTRTLPMTVRFIELMPFSGSRVQAPPSWTAQRMLEALISLYPGIAPVASRVSSTARLYQAPGFAGKIGIIGGYSRDFCSRCNKVRITPQGILQTCLYARGGLDLRKLLRGGAADEELVYEIKRAVAEKPATGHSAALRNSGRTSSMAVIGG